MLRLEEEIRKVRRPRAQEPVRARGGDEAVRDANRRDGGVVEAKRRRRNPRVVVQRHHRARARADQHARPRAGRRGARLDRTRDRDGPGVERQGDERRTAPGRPRAPTSLLLLPAARTSVLLSAFVLILLPLPLLRRLLDRAARLEVDAVEVDADAPEPPALEPVHADAPAAAREHAVLLERREPSARDGVVAPVPQDARRRARGPARHRVGDVPDGDEVATGLVHPAGEDAVAVRGDVERREGRRAVRERRDPAPPSRG